MIIYNQFSEQYEGYWSNSFFEEVEALRHIKRKVVGLSIGIVILVVVYFGSFLLVCPAINDARVKKIENEYTVTLLPPQTERIKTYSFCGNTSGTGNHVEIWVGTLIKSELSVSEINHWFQSIKWSVSAYDPSVFQIPEDLSNVPSFIEISQLENFTKEQGYYIVGCYYDAATQHDIRGH